jgi:hypothetical protein
LKPRVVAIATTGVLQGSLHNLMYAGLEENTVNAR